MRFYTTLWAKTNDNNKNLGEWKKTLQTKLQWTICMTLNCVRPTQFSVIQTIYCNVGLMCFFSILRKCLFVNIVMYEYFIDVSQNSVEMHLRCGGICNNRVIANCLQSVPVKEFWKSVNNWQRYGQKQSATFFGPPCTKVPKTLLDNTSPINELN